jgi:hypothetical protein
MIEIEDVIAAVAKADVKATMISQNRKGGDILIGLGNSSDLKRHGIFAVSGGALLVSPGSIFSSDEIAVAVKAFCDALPSKGGAR